MLSQGSPGHDTGRHAGQSSPRSSQGLLFSAVCSQIVSFGALAKTQPGLRELRTCSSLNADTKKMGQYLRLPDQYCLHVED